MEWETYLRTVAALVFVLALISGVAWFLRRFGMGGGLVRRGARRLAVTEILPIDSRRKLVLVRRDGVEHLLLVGGTSDLVVERDCREQGPHPEQGGTQP